MMELTGRTALVTGSVQGIGLAIAEALAGVGARIAVHGLAGDQQIDETLCKLPVHSTIRCIQRFTKHVFQFTGTAKIFILVGNEVGIFLHEDFAGFTQVEDLGVVAEHLAVDTGPDQPAVGVDVDFGHAQRNSVFELVGVYALGPNRHFAACGIDASDLVLGY